MSLWDVCVCVCVRVSVFVGCVCVCVCVCVFSKGYRTCGFVSLQVVIKYVPYVGDSKRAMDEYSSEIMMGGSNTIALHNTCEVSILVECDQTHREPILEDPALK